MNTRTEYPSEVCVLYSAEWADEIFCVEKDEEGDWVLQISKMSLLVDEDIFRGYAKILREAYDELQRRVLIDGQL